MSDAQPDQIAGLPTRWLDGAVLAASALGLAGVALQGVAPLQLVVLGAALVLLLGTWAALRRRALNGGRGWPLVLAAVLVPCFVGTLVTPSFATFQILAYPLAWLLTPGLRTALAANVLVTAAISAGYAFSAEPLEVVVVEGVSLAFSLALGTWISRIADQSASRQLLIDRLTAAQDQLAALHRDAGALAERERLARDLHDTFTQSLTGMVMLAERARARHPDDAALDVLEDAARQALSEARSLVTAGAPVPLEGGLSGALQVLAERFHRETGLLVEAHVATDVPRDLEVVLLRCAQEGLANVRKHAGATAVALRVAQQEDRAVLTITDDGSGPDGSGAGFGIAGMRDRLALVSGDVALDAGADGGAVLTVRVPLAGVAA